MLSSLATVRAKAAKPTTLTEDELSISVNPKEKQQQLNVPSKIQLVHIKEHDDFGRLIQKYLHLFLLFEDENDIVCIFQLNEAFVTGYLNPGEVPDCRTSLQIWQPNISRRIEAYSHHRHIVQVPPRVSDSLLLGVVYRSPSSPPEDDQFLIRTLGQLASGYHFTNMLLVGDLKAPKAPWMELQRVGLSGPFAAAPTKVVQQSAWTQHVIAPTRYRAGQQPSLLDLVITNERHFVDQMIINAPLGRQKYRTQRVNSKLLPSTLFRNAHLPDQLNPGPASVADIYRTIAQKLHEANAMFVTKKTSTQSDDPQATQKDLASSGKAVSTIFQKFDYGRRNVLFKYVRHRRRNKPSVFSSRDRNGEPTSDPIAASEVYREHFACLYSVSASSSHAILSRRNYELPLTDLVFAVEDLYQMLPDEVHPMILKEMHLTLQIISTWLFVSRLTSAAFPLPGKKRLPRQLTTPVTDCRLTPTGL
ncbi:hypothetical protein CLF_109370 [Clonorchis sinensis]|uniref:Uncharacterized protein n=1 Tax=Clonorchis sinensis TaxID=79923 RepID=G7YJ95_CLOSI|nr:hypothetical protein CLF_109370 [Clonorchis sinensis]